MIERCTEKRRFILSISIASASSDIVMCDDSKKCLKCCEILIATLAFALQHSRWYRLKFHKKFNQTPQGHLALSCIVWR